MPGCGPTTSYYWVSNYLLGNAPPAFDILFWNNDTTALPAALHSDYLDLITVNPFRNPGALRLSGTPIDTGASDLRPHQDPLADQRDELADAAAVETTVNAVHRPAEFEIEPVTPIAEPNYDDIDVWAVTRPDHAPSAPFTPPTILVPGSFIVDPSPMSWERRCNPAATATANPFVTEWAARFLAPGAILARSVMPCRFISKPMC